MSQERIVSNKILKCVAQIANAILMPLQCVLSKFFLALIYLYRFGISPFTPSSCRFHPTCSEYGLIAIKRHGAVYGGWLTFMRILRCNPLYEGGFDPVPPKQIDASRCENVEKAKDANNAS